MLRRVRFEIARRLNRYRTGNRWTQAVVGGRHIVEYKDRRLELRAGSSDYPTFIEVFDCKAYDLSPFPQWEWIIAAYDASERPLIIDAGANIGLTSLWLADQFPRAIILALEPEPGNFAELVRHTKDNPSIRPMMAALTPRDGFVAITDPGLGEWGFRTEASDSGIPAYSIETLCKEGEPLILKIDIEGGEKGIFTNPETLDRFAAVFIEPHDWMLPGQGTLDSFLKSVGGLSRDFLITGANVVSVKR